MGYLQITYNDLENLIETARGDRPYLVYSYKLKKMPNPSGYNKLNDKSVIVCWVGKEEIEDKESVALVILPEKESLEVQKNCIHVRKHGGKIKYTKFLHNYFTEKLFVINTELEKLEKKAAKKEEEKEEWFPVIKSSYQVKVTKYLPGQKISCPLMGFNYEVTQDSMFVITGPCGERFPISSPNLQRDYLTPDGNRINQDFLVPLKFEMTVDAVSRALPIKYFAKKIPLDEKKVFPNRYSQNPVSNRDGIPHGTGDYLVITEKTMADFGSDFTLVNGLVFEKTYKRLKTESVEPQLKEKLTTAFNAKKSSYLNIQNKLLSNPLENHLKRPKSEYRGQARDVLTCYSDRDGKNVYKEHLTELQLVMFGDKHYLVPKNFVWILKGTVDDHYYNNFIKDAQFLESALKNSILYAEQYDDFAKYVDELQDEIMYQKSLDDYAEQRHENSKTLLGSLKNVFTRNPYKKK